ncbi:MAG: hypothetical protein Q8P49_00245 [Candidatus Liptonbacteria bacterium]|nr:hypothetical protein [Candidatus Liptonbacteria bacterium]
MVELLQNIGNGIVVAILAISAAINGFVSVIQMTVAPPGNVASVYNAATIPPAKDPFIFIPDAPPVSSVATSTDATSSLKTAPIPPTETKAEKKAPAPAQKTPAPQAHATAPKTITAQWLLDNTSFFPKQSRYGNYIPTFTVDVGNRNLAWNISDAYVGGDATMPKFAFSFSCDPPLEKPLADSPEQTNFLKIRTSYDCTVGFGATSGSDQRMFTKKISVQTGAGQLVVTPPPAMNAVLDNDTNHGGIVLENQDSKAITITKLVFDISYVGLNTQGDPLVLQILDPTTNAILLEYHMENIALDSSKPYTHAATAVEMPLSFTLQPADKKLLPILLLGVQRMRMYGVDPTVTLTLRSITINPSDTKQILNRAQVNWKCIVALGGYDPNATSGPYATGNACK